MIEEEIPIKYNWNDLQKFVGVGRRIRKPLVTITSIPTIQLNSSFLHEFSTVLFGKTHVILHYSKNNNSIVFEFTSDPASEGAIKLTGKSNSKSFSIGSFLKVKGLQKESLIGRYCPKIEKIPQLGHSIYIILDNKKNQKEFI